MKSALFAIALMASGAALAQTYPDTTATDPVDTAAPADTTATMDTTMTAPLTATTGQIAEPSNADPEHDARGIAVISDPATVPAGFNGTPASAVGGPLIDPATGAPAEESYPACTATVTDNCLQTYERGRSAD